MDDMKTSVVDIHKVKGKRPEFDVYIGRRVRYHNEYTKDLKEYWYKDSKWANHYTLKKYGEMALINYEMDMRVNIEMYPNKYNLEELRGKRLGDWCITTDKIEPLVCHGQILMKLLWESE